jgi:hypothetical protein
MRVKFVLAFIGIAVLIAACFLPWMIIESRNITVTGMDTAGTKFGKPGYFHLLWTSIFLVFLLIPKVWAQRAAVGVAAFNIAWAIRNFLIIPMCQMGECPEREIGLYLLMVAAFVMFVAPMVGQSDKMENSHHVK